LRSRREGGRQCRNVRKHIQNFLCFSFTLFDIAVRSHARSFYPSKPLFLTDRVVDINTALVDDGLVDKEKIGGSNYFWSFPGKKDRQLQISHENTLAEIERAKARVAEAQSRLADAKRGREDENGERAKKLARMVELEKEKKELTAELGMLKENDPQALADLEKELKLVKEAAHRWTDNIFTVSCEFAGMVIFFVSS
jgi:Protein predicted to be involved in meiotic recombination